MARLAPGEVAVLALWMLEVSGGEHKTASLIPWFAQWALGTAKGTHRYRCPPLGTWAPVRPHSG